MNAKITKFIYPGLESLRVDLSTQGLFYLFAFLLPTQLTINFWPEYSYLSGLRIDYLSPQISIFDIVCTLILMITFWKFFQNRKYGADTICPKAILAFGLLTIVNTITSINPFITVYRFAKLGLYFGASWILVHQIIRETHFQKILRRVIYFAVAGTLIVVILAVLQFFNKSSLGGLLYFMGERSINMSLPGIAKITIDGAEYLRPYSTFSHPNSMAGYLIVIFFLAQWCQRKYADLNRKIGTDVSTTKYILQLVQIASIVGILVSFSRNAIVTCGILILFQILNLKKVVLTKRIGFSIILFIAINIAFMSLRWDDNSLNKRFFLLQRSVLLISQHPLVGTGFGTSIVAFARLGEPLAGKFTDTLQPTHNIYFLALSEFGIIGIIFLVYILKELFMGCDIRKMPTFAILAIFLTGQADHYWLTLPQNIALMCLTLVTALVASNRKKISQ
jgi:hypothetical protein